MTLDNLTLDEIIDGLNSLSYSDFLTSYDLQVLEEAILYLEELRDTEDQ